MSVQKISVSFLWLISVGLLGLILRLFPVAEIDLNYKNVLHAHSHIAFLGWVFTALFILIIKSFLSESSKSKRIYRIQFRLFMVINSGMLISFLYQGYGLFSIIFSTLHIAAAFWFAINIIRENKAHLKGNSPLSVKFLIAGLTFMMLSSLGPLSLPLIMKFFGAGSPMYHNAIYFYLHFQYNGWFIFALSGLFFKLLEKEKTDYPLRLAKSFFIWLVIATILSFSLSLLWNKPPKIVWLIGNASSIIQMVALVAFLRLLLKIKTNSIFGRYKFLFRFIVLAFVIKVISQFLSSMPDVVEVTASSRHFVIAYLHLILLGIVTCSIFGFYLLEGYINPDNRRTKPGLGIFLTGFLLTEILAVSQGVFNYFSSGISNYFFIQLGGSIIMFTGIILLITARKKSIVLSH